MNILYGDYELVLNEHESQIEIYKDGIMVGCFTDNTAVTGKVEGEQKIKAIRESINEIESDVIDFKRNITSSLDTIRDTLNE
jgi:hypothetical protein